MCIKLTLLSFHWKRWAQSVIELHLNPVGRIFHPGRNHRWGCAVCREPRSCRSNSVICSVLIPNLRSKSCKWWSRCTLNTLPKSTYTRAVLPSLSTPITFQSSVFLQTLLGTLPFKSHAPPSWYLPVSSTFTSPHYTFFLFRSLVTLIFVTCRERQSLIVSTWTTSSEPSRRLVRSSPVMWRAIGLDCTSE